MTGPLGQLCVVTAGTVGPQCLGAGDHLADRREHLGVARSGLVVCPGEVALHAAQHDGQRRSRDEGDHGEHPVVGQHHACDHEHQAAIEQPGERTPREELRQGLDVARDSGNQGPPSLLAMVGDAQPVDVFEQPHPQSVEGLLAAHPQAGDRCALRDGGKADHDEPDRPEHRDFTDVDASLSEPAVDGLLHQDRHHDAPGGADHRQRERRPEAAAQRRRSLDSLTDQVHC